MIPRAAAQIFWRAVLFILDSCKQALHAPLTQFQSSFKKSMTHLVPKEEVAWTVCLHSLQKVEHLNLNQSYM